VEQPAERFDILGCRRSIGPPPWGKGAGLAWCANIRAGGKHGRRPSVLERRVRCVEINTETGHCYSPLAGPTPACSSPVLTQRGRAASFDQVRCDLRGSGTAHPWLGWK